MAKGKLLFEGVLACKGSYCGKVRLINGDEEKLKQIKDGEILVGEDIAPRPGGISEETFNKYLTKAAAVIQNSGTSHPAVVFREAPHKAGCPVVLNTNGIGTKVEATKHLTDGQLVCVEKTRDEIRRHPVTGKEYAIPIGGVYEWIPDKTEQKPPPAASFNMADFLKKHGMQSKGE